MSALAPAPSGYDQRDQQDLRNELRLRDLKTVKIDQAIDRLYFKDAVTGETGLLTVQSGVVTWTAL